MLASSTTELAIDDFAVARLTLGLASCAPDGDRPDELRRVALRG
jgi:hypothetical protein